MQRALLPLARHAAALGAGLLLASGLTTASARNHAILAGVAQYQNASIAKLDAPGNDVKRMWDFLRGWKFEPADVAVLSDDTRAFKGQLPSRLQLPTAANILKALDDLIARLSAGPRQDNEFVVVYFSGHGSFHREKKGKPAGIAPEPDGNDEVLLAIDAKNFDTGSGRIEGGILDDELKERLDKLEKLATVWLIIDSCHAGGATRSALGDDLKYKMTAPAALNAPVHTGPLPGDAQSSTGWLPKQQATSNKLIAFLAVEKNALAIERKMSIPGVEGEHFSLFTHFLLEALQQPGLTTYRAIAEEVHGLIAKQSQNIPMPVFEGALDKEMPGGRAGWTVSWNDEAKDVTINVGTLAGVRADTIFALVRTSANPEQVIGYAKVRLPTPSTSAADLLDKLNDAPVAKPGKADFQGRIQARIVQAPASFVLTVARPPALDCDPVLQEQEAKRKLAPERRTKADLRMLNEAIGILDKKSEKTRTDAEKGDGGYLIDFVSPGVQALVQLCVSRDVVYLVGEDGRLDTNPRRPTPGHRLAGTPAELAEKLHEDLWKIVRQQNLLRIAGETGKSPIAGQVTVQVKLDRDESSFKSARDKELRECTNFAGKLNWENAKPLQPAGAVVGQPAPASKKPVGRKTGDARIFTVFGDRLTHCDRLIVEVSNESDKDIDVTLLYLDSLGAIGAVSEKEGSRIARSDPTKVQPPQRFPIKIVTWCPSGKFDDCLKQARDGKTSANYAPVGIERLAVIIAEANSSVPRVYSNLAQSGLNQVRTRSARGDLDAFDDLLSQAALPGHVRTRSVNRGGDAGVKIFQWEVVPPDELNKPNRK